MRCFSFSFLFSPPNPQTQHAKIIAEEKTAKGTLSRWLAEQVSSKQGIKQFTRLQVKVRVQFIPVTIKHSIVVYIVLLISVWPPLSCSFQKRKVDPLKSFKFSRQQPPNKKVKCNPLIMAAMISINYN